MKVTVTKKAAGETPLKITTEFIKLEAALKLANIAESGGMAKNMILDGLAKVNGEVCTMRGKKLYPDDHFSCMGQNFVIVGNEAE